MCIRDRAATTCSTMGSTSTHTASAAASKSNCSTEPSTRPASISTGWSTDVRWVASHRATHLTSVHQPVLIDAGRVDGSVEQFDLLAAADAVWVLVDPI